MNPLHTLTFKYGSEQSTLPPPSSLHSPAQIRISGIRKFWILQIPCTPMDTDPPAVADCKIRRLTLQHPSDACRRSSVARARMLTCQGSTTPQLIAPIPYTTSEPSPTQAKTYRSGVTNGAKDRLQPPGRAVRRKSRQLENMQQRLEDRIFTSSSIVLAWR